MEGRHYLALLEFCQWAASVGGGCLVALSIEGTPSEPWAATGGGILPPCPLPPSSSERRVIGWTGAVPPAPILQRAGPCPQRGGLPPYAASTQSGFFPGEGRRPISPAPWPDVAIYREEVSPLVRPQAWTGKPREQGQMCPPVPAGPGDPTRPGNTGSTFHWAPNLGSREVTCIRGLDG